MQVLEPVLATPRGSLPRLASAAAHGSGEASDPSPNGAYLGDVRDVLLGCRVDGSHRVVDRDSSLVGGLARGVHSRAAGLVLGRQRGVLRIPQALPPAPAPRVLLQDASKGGGTDDPREWVERMSRATDSTWSARSSHAREAPNPECALEPRPRDTQTNGG